MNFSWINIIESVFTLAIFYLFYWIFLKKETFFQLNRLYLISSLLFAMIIPFLNFNLGSLFSSGNGIIDKISGIKLGYYQLNEVVIYAYSGGFSWEMIKEYINFVYILGAIVSFVFFVFGLGRIIVMILRSNPKKYGKYRIVETPDAIVPFSLFKWIIINPEKFSSDDMEQIIAHEKMHAFQLHSFDLIFIEVLVILFWFNPFIYWYRKSIREIHEYLADRAVVENGFDRVDYQQLLLSQVSGNRFIGLTSRFSYSLSKNRLKMLTMMKSKNSSKIKVALAIPLIILATFLFSNPAELVKANKGFKIEKDLAMFKDTTVNSEETTERINEKGEIIISSKDGVEKKVYFTCDVMPKFEGQDVDTFRTFIQKNLKYPEEALKKNIEGRVFVQFDIDVDGSLTDAKIVRGVDPSLDKEALRVTMLSPKWEPAMDKGKKVRTRFTFPIVFKM